MTDEDDEEHPEKARFLQLLSNLEFADRYYAFCSRHDKRGPEIPLATATAILKEVGRTFRYHKGEKFFAWRDANAPEGCELGLNLKIEVSYVEWILVFGTPSGHIGGQFSGLARAVKLLRVPNYRHNPPHPRPHAASKLELAAVLEEGLTFYDEIADAISKHTWK